MYRCIADNYREIERKEHIDFIKKLLVEVGIGVVVDLICLFAGGH